MVKFMRRYSTPIKNERGHMLLFIVIAASIILILFTSGAKLFIHAIDESRFLLEQLEVETIIQMSKRDIVNLQSDLAENLAPYYNFSYPNGEIYIRINNLNENTYVVINEIELANGSEYETIYEIELQD